MKTSTKKSKIAITLTVIYLLLVVAAFAVLFAAQQDDSLAGIFVVMVAMPWSIFLTWLTETLSIESMAFNTVFLAVGCYLNAVILYSSVSFIARIFRRNP